MRRRRDLALLPAVLVCAVLEAYLLIFHAIQQLPTTISIRLLTIVAATNTQVGPYLLTLNTELQAVFLVVMMWTVYREQARERRRQLFVESEIRSAQEIQRVLVPEETPAVPGFAIGSLYWPAGEVGGDMFQVLPGEAGDVTVVLADVSGKGLKAAMTVSLMGGQRQNVSGHYDESDDDPRRAEQAADGTDQWRVLDLPGASHHRERRSYDGERGASCAFPEWRGDGNGRLAAAGGFRTTQSLRRAGLHSPKAMRCRCIRTGCWRRRTKPGSCSGSSGARL